MPIIYFSPSWFYKYAVAFELIFAIISLVLSLFAFKLSQITGQRKAGIFSASFFLISISYFIRSIFNFLILSKLNEAISHATNILSVVALDYFGAYSHMAFMLSGIVSLLYMTFDIKNGKVLAFMISSSIAALILSRNPFYTFYLFTTICLISITWSYIRNYLNKKKPMILLIALAFLFMLFSSIHFLISIDHPIFYMIGHISELAAYLLILINFYLVRKK